MGPERSRPRSFEWPRCRAGRPDLKPWTRGRTDVGQVLRERLACDSHEEASNRQAHHLVNAVCGSARKLIESTQPVSARSTRISEKYFEPCDSAEGKYRTGAREQNRTADLFITSDLALNAVLILGNPTFSTVFKRALCSKLFAVRARRIAQQSRLDVNVHAVSNQSLLRFVGRLRDNEQQAS